MSLHTIATDDPQYRKLSQALADTEEAERRTRERVGAIQAANDEKLAEYERTRRAAVLSGQEPPPEPDLAPNRAKASDFREFYRRQANLAEAQSRHLASDADRLARVAAERRRELAAEVDSLLVDVLPRLTEIAAESGDLNYTVWLAERSGGRSQQAGQDPVVVGVGDLLSLAAHRSERPATAGLREVEWQTQPRPELLGLLDSQDREVASGEVTDGDADEATDLHVATADEKKALAEAVAARQAQGPRTLDDRRLRRR